MVAASRINDANASDSWAGCDYRDFLVGRDALVFASRRAPSRPFCLLSVPESVTLSGQNDLRHDVLVQAEDVVGIVGSFQPNEFFVFGIAVDGPHDALAGLDHVVHIVAARGEGF
jgi:hypothetical protein